MHFLTLQRLSHHLQPLRPSLTQHIKAVYWPTNSLPILKQVRVTKGKLASGSIVPKPDILLQRRKPRPLPGDKDTSLAEVLKPTFNPGDMPSLLPALPTSLDVQQRTYSSAALNWQTSHIPQLTATVVPRLGQRWGLWRGFAASALGMGL